MSLTEIPENDVDILEPIPLVEKEETPVFHDEGKFTVIEGSDVESGTYLIDTRVVSQLLDDKEWETLLKLKSDNKIIDTNAEDDYAIPVAYRDEGEVYRLWDKSEDPKGEKAKLVHEKIIELVRKNTPPDTIYDEVLKLKEEFQSNVNKLLATS